MKKALYILFFVILFTLQMSVSFADRGVGKKKNKVVLNIKSPVDFTKSLNFNLKNGLRYTGSLVSIPAVSATAPSFNLLVTYQKGNSVYILPYKKKILVADVRQGYTGTKLIIRVH
ncbi:MAG: hypothetical protein ACKVOM_04100 [Ferruginibacter sp.]